MNSNGYNVKWSDGKSYESDISGLAIRVDYTKIFRNYRLYVIPETSNSSYYWLASPSAYSTSNWFNVRDSGNVGGDYYGPYYGVRPVVCLQSGVQLVSNGDGTYKLSK